MRLALDAPRAWLRRLRARRRAARARLRVHAPACRALFPPGVRLACVAWGLRFTEGPLWWDEAGCLLFSDIPADRIYRLAPPALPTVFRSPSRHANGLTRDRDGCLLACEHGARRVTRTLRDGTVTVVADAYGGRRLNSPNDVVVHTDGSVYFTDPPYGIAPGAQEQPVQGIYRVPATGGAPELVADDFERPNGLAFSPDERWLYVTDSSARRHLRALAVRPDGGLADGRVLCDMRGVPGGAPDGLAVDRDGRIFTTGPGGIWVLTPEGEHLGTIEVPEPPSNCAFGGADGRSLWITARTSIYRVGVIEPGMVPR